MTPLLDWRQVSPGLLLVWTQIKDPYDITTIKPTSNRVKRHPTSAVMAFDPRVDIGPVQVGAILSAAFFGCFVAQTYMYYKRFPKDPLSLKLIVAAVAAFQLGHFVCLIATLWSMTVLAFGNPSILKTFPIAADVLILLSSFTCSLVQLFYTNRLWRLSQVTVLFLVAAALCVVAQTAATILVVRAFRMTSLEAFGYEQHLIIIIASISRASADIFTTIGIAGTLKKSSSGTTAMTTIADRLIAWTLETCLAASIATCTIAILLLTLRNNLVWFGLYVINSNVIANSLMAWFNRRYSPPLDGAISTIAFGRSIA